MNIRLYDEPLKSTLEASGLREFPEFFDVDDEHLAWVGPVLSDQHPNTPEDRRAALAVAHYLWTKFPEFRGSLTEAAPQQASSEDKLLSAVQSIKIPLWNTLGDVVKGLLSMNDNVKAVQVATESSGQSLRESMLSSGQAVVEVKNAIVELKTSLEESNKKLSKTVFRFGLIALFLVLLSLILTAKQAFGQWSQITVITFKDNLGIPVKVYASPFSIWCDTGITCTPTAGNNLKISSTGAAGFPRLDQVLDPTADKTFDMGAHFLRLTLPNPTTPDRIVFRPPDGDFDPLISFGRGAVSVGAILTGAITDAATSLQIVAQGKSSEAMEATAYASGLIDADVSSTLSIGGEIIGSGNGRTLQAIDIALDDLGSATNSIYNGIHIAQTIVMGVGTLAQANGIIIDDQTAGTTNSAIKTGLGQNSFGDITHGTRFSVKNATALANTDFALSAGWGASGSIAVNRGTDQAFDVTVTAAGAGVSLDPTVTLTFKDGTWTTVPVLSCKQKGGTGIESDVNQSETATTIVLTWLATPVAGDTYNFSCTGMGI